MVVALVLGAGFAVLVLLALYLCLVITFASPLIWPPWSYRLSVVLISIYLILLAVKSTDGAVDLQNGLGKFTDTLKEVRPLVDQVGCAVPRASRAGGRTLAAVGRAGAVLPLPSVLRGAAACRAAPRPPRALAAHLTGGTPSLPQALAHQPAVVNASQGLHDAIREAWSCAGCDGNSSGWSNATVEMCQSFALHAAEMVRHAITLGGNGEAAERRAAHLLLVEEHGSAWQVDMHMHMHTSARLAGRLLTRPAPGACRRRCGRRCCPASRSS